MMSTALRSEGAKNGYSALAWRRRKRQNNMKTKRTAPTNQVIVETGASISEEESK